jgi:hypothetical protein
MRIREEIFRVDLEPRGGRGAGRHLGQVREPQPDAGATSAGAERCRSGGRVHRHAFGFMLPITMRSQ